MKRGKTEKSASRDASFDSADGTHSVRAIENLSLKGEPKADTSSTTPTLAIASGLPLPRYAGVRLRDDGKLTVEFTFERLTVRDRWRNAPNGAVAEQRIAHEVSRCATEGFAREAVSTLLGSWPDDSVRTEG